MAPSSPQPKHLTPDPDQLLTLSLTSLGYTNPWVRVDVPNKIVSRRPIHSTGPFSPSAALTRLPPPGGAAAAAPSSRSPSRSPSHSPRPSISRPRSPSPLPANPSAHVQADRLTLPPSTAPPPRRVAVVSGGGSGHEPSFTGLVGPGLLDAAVAGSIFASPSGEQVRKALLHRISIPLGRNENKRGDSTGVAGHANADVDIGGAGAGSSNTPLLKVESNPDSESQKGHGNTGFGDSGHEIKIQSDDNADGGALVIIMNYTGDLLNFGIAIEQVRAERGQDAVELVVVGDDVAVGRNQGGKVGRRGIAGTCLVVKIAGALAEKGASLKECARVARLAAENVVSVGASLSLVHVPGQNDSSSPSPSSDSEPHHSSSADRPIFHLGLGIHNESAVETAPLTLPDVVARMLSWLLSTSDPDRSFLPALSDHHPTPAIVLINNLGGLSNLELSAAAGETMAQLRRDFASTVTPVRVLVGTYMTSLNGPGFSISIMAVADTGIPGSGFVDLLDDPAEAPGWPGASISADGWAMVGPGTALGDEGLDVPPIAEDDDSLSAERCGVSVGKDLTVVKKMVTAGLRNVVSQEPEITRLDKIAGDGDCGTTVKRGAEAVLAVVEELGGADDDDDAAVLVHRVARAVMRSMDGTSGALYAIFLNALEAAVRSQVQSHREGGAAGSSTISSSPAQPSQHPSSPTSARPINWPQALRSALEVLYTYTPARPGDRTLVDPLAAWIEHLTSSLSSSSSSPGSSSSGPSSNLKATLAEAAQRAQDATAATGKMRPVLGRSVYVESGGGGGGGGAGEGEGEGKGEGGKGEKGGKRRLENVPDPGAVAISAFFHGLAEGC